MARTKKTTRSPRVANKSGSNDVFDIDRVRQLIELMKQHELSEIELRQDEKRIRLRCGGIPAVAYSAPPLAPPVAAAQPSAGSAATPAADTDEPHIQVIRSPMVGTFYARPKPDAEPYVKVGDHVSSETTICIIEAMKVYNEIPADCNGQIVAVLVENEQPVDVDKPMFKVDTSK